MNASTLAGRSGPLHHHCGPQALALRPDPLLAELQTLYVVGGLYGNGLALREGLRLFEQERGRKGRVFNGRVFNGELHLEAIAIETPAAQMQQRFVQHWPEGSDAHAFYFSRIAAGPACHEADVIRWED